jgi:hypothetical protein
MKKLGSLIVSRILSQQSRWLMLILLLGLAAAGLVLAWDPPVTADDDDDDKSELLVSNIGATWCCCLSCCMQKARSRDSSNHDHANHPRIKGSTLGRICSQAGTSRADFIRAFGEA